jgi:hypothetical protein
MQEVASHWELALSGRWREKRAALSATGSGACRVALQQERPSRLLTLIFSSRGLEPRAGLGGVPHVSSRVALEVTAVRAMRARSLNTRAAALLAMVSSACSFTVDADRAQCVRDDDCATRGFANTSCVAGVCQAIEAVEDPEWSCLGEFEPPSLAEGELVPYRLRFEGSTQPNVPPLNLSIRLCSNLDWKCDSPILGIPQPDASGSVTLELERTFRGFLEVEATGLKPTLVFLPPLVTWPPREELFRLIQAAEFVALAEAVQIPYNPALGFSVLLAQNCLGNRASGVVLASADGDESTLPYFFKGGVPDFDAVQTDVQGAGGWTWIPVGQVSAEARRASTGELIGVAGYYSRPDHISYVPIGPTLAP